MSTRVLVHTARVTEAQPIGHVINRNRSTETTELCPMTEGYRLGKGADKMSSRSTKNYGHVQGGVDINSNGHKRNYAFEAKTSRGKAVSNVEPTSSKYDSRKNSINAGNVGSSVRQVETSARNPKPTASEVRPSLEEINRQKGLVLERIRKTSRFKDPHTGIIFDGYEKPKGYEDEELSNSQQFNNSQTENYISPTVYIAEQRRRRRVPRVASLEETEEIIKSIRSGSARHRNKSNTTPDVSSETEKDNVTAEENDDKEGTAPFNDDVTVEETEDQGYAAATAVFGDFPEDNSLSDSLLYRATQCVDELCLPAPADTAAHSNTKENDFTSSFPLTSTPYNNNITPNATVATFDEGETPKTTRAIGSLRPRTNKNLTLHPSNNSSFGDLNGHKDDKDTPKGKHLKFGLEDASPIKPVIQDNIVGEFDDDDDDDLFMMIPTENDNSPRAMSRMEVECSSVNHEQINGQEERSTVLTKSNNTKSEYDLFELSDMSFVSQESETGDVQKTFNDIGLAPSSEKNSKKRKNATQASTLSTKTPVKKSHPSSAETPKSQQSQRPRAGLSRNRPRRK